MHRNAIECECCRSLSDTAFEVFVKPIFEKFVTEQKLKNVLSRVLNKNF